MVCFYSVRDWLRVREIFVASNDAYVFFDANVDVNHDLGDLDCGDFHRYESVFKRIMGW